jgi:hypothetical protein
MSVRVALAAVLAGAAASIAGAQQVASTDALDSAAAVQVGRIVQDAQTHGLPTERIVAKVRRGLQLHAPSTRIVAAALAPSPSAADVEAGEDALSLGIHVGALTSLHAVNPTQSIAVPLGLLTQLVASGVSPKRATDMVAQLIRRGATSGQLMALGNDVNSDVGRGARADASLDARMIGLTAVLAPGATAGTAADVAANAPGTVPKRPKTP